MEKSKHIQGGGSKNKPQEENFFVTYRELRMKGANNIRGGGGLKKS